MRNTDFVKIAWFGKHFGEEPPLIGRNGAGGIFFTGCNLRCVYCQNFQISQQNIGKDYSIEELVSIILKLQSEGAENIDLVTPTIWAKQIREVIKSAKEQGLKIPVVWNSNAFETAKLIKSMEGLVDIYLPDFKYGNNETAFKYSGVRNYVEKAKETIAEMLRQVGSLKVSEKGSAEGGIIIRHLILPNNVENSLRVLDYASEIDKNVFFSLMSQYEPVNHAKDFNEINRRITKEEFNRVCNYLLELGFHNGWVQDMDSSAFLLPDFTKGNPFS